MAEDKFETSETKNVLRPCHKRPLSENIFYGNEKEHHEKSCYSKGHEHHLNIPRFHLRRRWSELAMPTILRSTKRQKGQKVNKKT